MEGTFTIDYLALFVRDVERAVAFYRDVLGFQFPDRVKNEGAEGKNGTLRVGIYGRDWLPRLFGERGTVPNSGTAFLLSMHVPDLDAAYRYLLDRQVEIIAPPRSMPWGDRTLFFNDPDGNVLEMVERR